MGQQKPIEDHIKLIRPDYLIISAPKQKNSRHNHPHDDALELYKKHIKSENIYHLGESEKSIIADIDSGGKLTVSEEQNINNENREDSGVLYSTRDRVIKTKPYSSYVN